MSRARRRGRIVAILSSGVVLAIAAAVGGFALGSADAGAAVGGPMAVSTPSATPTASPSVVPSPSPSPSATPATPLPADCDAWLGDAFEPYLAVGAIVDASSGGGIAMTSAELDATMVAGGGLRCGYDPSTMAAYGPMTASIRTLAAEEVSDVRNVLYSGGAQCVQVEVGLTCVASAEFTDDQYFQHDEVHVLAGDLWIVVSVLTPQMVTRGAFLDAVLAASPLPR